MVGECPDLGVMGTTGGNLCLGVCGGAREDCQPSELGHKDSRLQSRVAGRPLQAKDLPLQGPGQLQARCAASGPW